MKSKDIEIKILNFKLIKESVDVAEVQLVEGFADFQFRLSNFRKKLEDTSQVEKFDKQFFNSEEETDETDIVSSDLLDDEEISLKETSSYRHPVWIKKVYRKVVLSTHPDKFVNFPIERLRLKYLKIYKEAVDAMDLLDYSTVLLCAYESDVEITNNEAIEFLDSGISERQSKMHGIKKKLHYQWYHLSDEQKEKFLTNYLKQLGYKFTKEQIRKVLKNVRKRKTGVRPERTKRVKIKKMN